MVYWHNKPRQWFIDTINHGKETHQDNQTLGRLGRWKEHSCQQFRKNFCSSKAEKAQVKTNPKLPVPERGLQKWWRTGGNGLQLLQGKYWCGIRNQLIASINSNPGISYRGVVECSLLELSPPQPDRDNLSTEGWTRWAPEMPPNLDFPLFLKMPGVLLWHFFLPSIFKTQILVWNLYSISQSYADNLIIKRNHFSTSWTKESSSTLSQTFYS